MKKFMVYFKGQMELEATSKLSARHGAEYLLNLPQIKKLEITQVRRFQDAKSS